MRCLHFKDSPVSPSSTDPKPLVTNSSETFQLAALLGDEQLPIILTVLRCFFSSWCSYYSDWVHVILYVFEHPLFSSGWVIWTDCVVLGSSSTKSTLSGAVQMLPNLESSDFVRSATASLILVSWASTSIYSSVPTSLNISTSNSTAVLISHLAGGRAFRNWYRSSDTKTLASAAVIDSCIRYMGLKNTV